MMMIMMLDIVPYLKYNAPYVIYTAYLFKYDAHYLFIMHLPRNGFLPLVRAQKHEIVGVGRAEKVQRHHWGS
jgi:hypothetical protein